MHPHEKDNIPQIACDVETFFNCEHRRQSHLFLNLREVPCKHHVTPGRQILLIEMADSVFTGRQLPVYVVSITGNSFALRDGFVMVNFQRGHEDVSLSEKATPCMRCHPERECPQ